MNQLPGKKERNAFNRASPAALAEGNDQELGELSLSGTHEQAVPFLRAASQLGGKVVQFAVQPVIDYNPRKISKKVLAAMSGDPDPVKTLSDIRSLLVGPTRSLHDAMFEEVIDILEESDREVQTALETLESNYYRLSDITDGLVTASVESRDKTRQQTEFFQAELQKSVAGQQEMLSEMFMAIDAKIAEMTARVDRKIEALAVKLEASQREAEIAQERNNQALEARCLASAAEAIDMLEARLGHLERKSSTDQAVIREVFADGLLNIADRFKTLHHG
ncbi:MAG TPA: hypothetical protein PLK44_07940 [Aestuariivirga sp.]|nr:hypothetical protein [Hyphomicrobiales bacterium]HQY73628.1 hypothetical protein [Aestuariivirga sp.]